VLGAGLWTTVLGVARHLLGRKFDEIDRYLGPASTAIMAANLIGYLYRIVRFKNPETARCDAHQIVSVTEPVIAAAPFFLASSRWRDGAQPQPR